MIAYNETVPVALPVTLPSRLDTKVPTAYVFPEVLTVVVGSTCKSLNNLNHLNH